MADTKEIMEALSWFTAERFKSLQRKLTTARNTIQSEALSSKLIQTEVLILYQNTDDLVIGRRM